MSNDSPRPDGMTFVLPLLNPGVALEPGLNAWCDQLQKLGREVELIIVDRGSTDPTGLETTTRDLVDKHGLPLQYLRSETGTGFGTALRLALDVAKQPLLFYTSLDYPYVPDEIHLLLNRLEEKDPETGLSLHLVTGYRSLTPIPPVRSVLGKLWRGFLQVAMNVPSEVPSGWLGKSANRFRFWMRALFGLRIQDVNSHFKLFRREIFQRIPIQSNGEFVHGEILAKANFLGCYMDEVAIVRSAGPFPASSEIPLVTRDVYRELNVVLKRPDFGSWPIETKKGPPTEVDEPGTVVEAAAVSIESPGPLQP